MHYELLMAFAAISRVSDAWQPDRPRRSAFDPRALRGRRRLFPVVRALATRLFRTEPKR
jgi:hypothetical protein